MKIRRGLAIFLAVCMVLPLLPAAALGAEEGTAISSQAELSAMKSSGRYYLADDIVLTGTWTPISSFSGTLDGNGHTVSGLDVKLTNSGYGGLFASLSSSGTVKDLHVEGTVQTSGGSAARCGGIVGQSYGTITSCTFSGKVFNEGGDNHALGGIVGRNDGQLISDCINYGEITGKSVGGGYNAVYVGGITGSDHGKPTPSITGCANYGVLSATVDGTLTYWGELFGSDDWQNNGAYVGGIAGDTQAGKIDNSNANHGVIIADNGQTVNLTGVPDAPDLTLPNGVPAPSRDELEASLPGQIIVQTDGSGRWADVTWDVAGSAYNPFTAGDYTVSGTVTLPGKITNSNSVGLSTSITVTVTTPAEAPPDTEVTWTVGGGASTNGSLSEAITALDGTAGGIIRVNRDFAAADDYTLSLSGLGSAVTLNLNGNTVDMGGHTLTLAKGTLTINGGGTLTGTGNPIQVGFLSANAKLVLENSAVESTGSTGAISLSQGTGFEMEGGSLTCTSGAALNITGDSTVAITGGTVTGNSVSGAIYATSGTLTLGVNGSTPSKTVPAIVNTAANTNAPALTGHKVNFYGGKLTFGKACATPIAVDSGGGLTLPANYELAITVEEDNATAVLKPTTAVSQAVWGVDAEHLTTSGTLFEAFAAAPAYIRLQTDVNLNAGDTNGSNRLVVSRGDHTLDLNGCTVSYAATIAGGELSQLNKEGLVYIALGASLTLADTGEGGKIRVTVTGETAPDTKDKSCVVHAQSGALKVEGGAIEMDASAVTVGELSHRFTAIAVSVISGDYIQTGGSISATGNVQENGSIAGIGLKTDYYPDADLSGGSIFGSDTGVEFVGMSNTNPDRGFSITDTAQISSNDTGLFLYAPNSAPGSGTVIRGTIAGGTITGKTAVEISGSTDAAITDGVMTGTRYGVRAGNRVRCRVTGGTVTAPCAIDLEEDVGGLMLGGSYALNGDPDIHTYDTAQPITLSAPLAEALVVEIAYPSTDHTVLAKSDGSYVLTGDDLEKLTCREVFGSPLKLVLEGEGAAAVIKFVLPPPAAGGGSVTTYQITAAAGAGGTIAPKGTVRVSRNSSKTFNITPDEGYVLADVLVDGVSVGRVNSYTFEKVMSKHSIEAAFRKITESPFSDVNEGDWCYEAVRYVHDYGLMNGTADTMFTPNGAVTRGMIITILYRLENSPAVTGPSFFDVAAGKYYTDAAAWGAANSIVNGYGNGRFGPDDNITREQLATILYRCAGSPSVTGTLAGFTDAAAASDYAIDALIWVVEQGVSIGKGGGILDPKGEATRAEAATMIMRYCKSITQ